jgi:hypothetical protein
VRIALTGILRSEDGAERENSHEVSLCGVGGHEEGLRRTRGDAAGAQPGSYSIQRITVNVGTVPGLSSARASSAAAGAGRIDRRSVGDGAEPP